MGILENLRIERLEKRTSALEVSLRDIELLIIQNNKSLQELLDAVNQEQKKKLA